MFWEGQPRGPSKLLYPDGSYEERSFNDGAKNGPAKMIGNNGDVFEFQYKDNVIDGPSKYTWASGQYEEAVYVGGVKHGPGLEVSDTGDTETRTWDSGQLQGPAVVMGKNGDKLEFSYSSVSEAVLFPCYCDSFTRYVQGVRQGKAVYTFADGSTEVSTYNDKGEQTGPAKFVWANGAIREGNKVTKAFLK